MSDYTSSDDSYIAAMYNIATQLKRLEQLRRYVMICGIVRSNN